jgi:hypothetical protein
VFLISDFLTFEDIAGSRELKILAARHDIVAVVVEDVAEHELPAGNAMVMFRDMESGRTRRVGLGPAERKRYAALMQQRREQLVNSFYQVPMDYVFVRTDQRAVESLLNLFAVRRRM